MNYRHSYHAGNACEVVKHSLLIAILKHLREKEKPFGVLDTHAGAGLYYLESSESAKTYEYEQGIKQLWKALPDHPILQAYLKTIQAFNSDGILKYYPGSPLIIDRFLGENDQLVCAELHPEDGKGLKNILKHQPQVSVHLQDGYLTPKAFLPFVQKRGVVFIDPPFEEKNEFDRMMRALKDGLDKFPQGIFMLWYPLKNKTQVQDFYNMLGELSITNLLKTEFYFYRTVEEGRLNGSGMVFVNLPWGIQDKLDSLFRELNSMLAFEASSPWLIDEIKLNF
ncbi:MAG: 23S rRNA (adenine(2030)-N(6))-methyltransferase RlmJ [Candidatus Paracaedibacteraceae bacterium]|nr:23S rRNA (adenine(2030)-N(6))-methyltransferase RlmJ [Candidatus Paracaedibacteraceae bacterium]